MPRATKQNAELKYALIRSRSREVADEIVRVNEPRLPRELASSLISPEALRIASNWPGRVVAWDWNEVANHYRRDHPDRFELAIWVGMELCALAAGYPSGSALHCSIEYLEGAPGAHPLAGFVILVATTHLETYARALGKREARLVNPINERVVELNSTVGYTFTKAPKGQANYCVKML